MGDHLDPTWANVRGYHPDMVMITGVTSFSEDSSPYGVRGMAGGVLDLCNDRWTRSCLTIDAGRAAILGDRDRRDRRPAGEVGRILHLKRHLPAEVVRLAEAELGATATGRYTLQVFGYLGDSGAYTGSLDLLPL